MAERAHSQVTTFDGGSHLTLISHPDAVTAVIQKAIDSVQRHDDEPLGSRRGTPAAAKAERLRPVPPTATAR